MEYKSFHSAFEALIGTLNNQKESEPVKRFIGELKEFLQHLDQTNQESVNEILQDFEAQTQEPLFQEVGKILRRFHDQFVTIREGIPTDLGKLANLELEDVTGKLNHILTMTDKAANKTMDLAEEMMEQIGNISENNRGLLERLTKVDNLEGEGAKNLIEDIKKRFEENNTQNESIHQKLTEVLIAQDYQDLTGQVIQKILDLLNNLEADLTNLLEKFGKATAQVEDTDEVSLKGPLEEGHVDKKSQDDVNDLLARFGF